MILYHGTTNSHAKKILENGFKKSKKESYTGTGLNLSKYMSVSYEYGEYENRGCVLEVELSDSAKYLELNNGTPSDKMFMDDPSIDFIKSYFGNIYVVWNMSCIKNIRKMTKKESIAILNKEFEEDGKNCCYNGEAQNHCDKYWNSL